MTAAAANKTMNRFLRWTNAAAPQGIARRITTGEDQITEVFVEARIQRKIAPTAFLRESARALDRRMCDDRERDAIPRVT
ncbi:MAG TPA: hypothetical protein VGC55_05705 [Dokdonella sp.]